MDQLIFSNLLSRLFFYSFIPNTIVACHDQDPPWLGEKIKVEFELNNMYTKNT